MTIYIDNETKLRVNIHYAYKEFSRLNSPEIRARANVVEIPDPPPPADFSEDTYFRTEKDDAPYVVYTLRPQEQRDEAAARKLAAKEKADAQEAVRGDSTIQYLTRHTDAAIIAKVKTLLPSLPPAEAAVIGRLAAAIGVLFRE